MKSNRIISWTLVLVVLVIIGWQLAGIGGAIGAALISFGLQKTIEDRSYSKNKKTLFSFVYVIAGVVLALVIAVPVTMLVYKAPLGDIINQTNPVVMNGSVGPNDGSAQSLTFYKTTSAKMVIKSNHPVTVCVLDQNGINALSKHQNYSCLNSEQKPTQVSSIYLYEFTETLNPGNYGVMVINSQATTTQFTITTSW
jgi:hypothetical protein